jgi:hypothetical protein
MAFVSGGRKPYRHRRVRIIGCGPGCLMTSVLLSVALTILVNLAIRLF